MEPAQLKDRPALRIERFYPRAPEKVWRAWTDPQALSRWFGPGPGECVSLAELDVRVGGRYRIVFGGADGKAHEVCGAYREVARQRRLVFTWTWPRTTPERESVVTIQLDAAPGGTLLILSHEQFFDESARDGHRRGWTESLARLEEALVAEPPRTALETVRSYFTALQGGGSWQPFLAEDLVFTSFTSPLKQLHGKAAYLESTRRFFSMVASVEVRDLIVQEGKVCALTRYALRPPHGVPIDCHVAEVFAVEDAKIRSLAIYFDSAPFPK